MIFGDETDVVSDTPASSAPDDFLGLLAHYDVPPGHFDELRTRDGDLRPHWRSFLRQSGPLRAGDFAQVQATIARQIHENGVTYNVYAAADGPARPWALDVLPMILPAAEWEQLARGLRQRARLLNAMAADLYGPQRLLADGLVPPALVLGHPGFLRAGHGVLPPKGIFLHLLAFDVARGPDGCFRVLGTRTQAPSGAGYALANRLIVSRLLRDAFRDLRVHMLAPFFRTLQQMLIAIAPSEGEAPHVVLLTPGPYNETYFEHAYLARYLGFTLAEGGDLTVRDDRVYLKTLTGLRRVHVILRRLDDDYCDPLELRADSTLGVAGLVQAWRAGHVVVANAFGMGVLETPALYGFLPAVCERLLGEPLEIPSIPTWWAGERAALEAGSRYPGDVVLKSAFPGRREEPTRLGDLGSAGREKCLQRLALSPGSYVFEEYLRLSHSPVWHQGRLESRAVMLRVALAADGRGDYRVMPGGLSRIAGDDRHVSGQRGGGSKETWVLSEAPVERASLLPGSLSLDDVVHSDGVVSSRAGENLFWLGRYAERTQNGARLVRAVLSRLPDSDAFPPGLYDAFLRTCHRHGLLSGPHEDYAGAPDLLERDLIGGVFDREERQSLAFGVERTLRAAGAVRGRLSPDNWRVLNRLSHSLAFEPERGAGLGDALELIDQAIVSLVAVAGLEMAHMTRDEGWRFLGLGRLVERLLFVVSTASEVTAGDDPREPALLDWLLDLFDKSITYRARYMRPPEWLGVMDLVLFDRRNPRSAAFQLDKLAKQVRLLHEPELDPLADAIEGAGAPEADLLGDLPALQGFLRSCEELALRLSDALTLRYFSHVYEPARATAVL